MQTVNHETVNHETHPIVIADTVVADLQNERRPDHVQHLQSAEQTVEDVVGRKHFDHPERVVRRVGDDAVGQQHDAREDPAEREQREQDVRQTPHLQVAEDLRAVQRYVGEVVDDHHHGADAVEVAGPGEREQQHGDDVVYEHLPEVLALDVEELRHDQRQVEAELDVVVPPGLAFDALWWIGNTVIGNTVNVVERIQ